MTELIEIIKQVPSLTVLGYIVLQFLRYIERRDVSLRETVLDFKSTTEQIWREAQQAREASREVIKTSTAVIAENTRAVDELRSSCRAINELNKP